MDSEKPEVCAHLAGGVRVCGPAEQVARCLEALGVKAEAQAQEQAADGVAAVALEAAE